MAEAAVPAAGEAIRQAVQAELVRMVAAHAAAFYDYLAGHYREQGCSWTERGDTDRSRTLQLSDTRQSLRHP
jgi:hypothetical protein